MYIFVLIFVSFSVMALVGHSPNEIFEGIFYGNYTFDGLLNVTGNIIANDPVDSNHVATKGYVDANSGGDNNGYSGWTGIYVTRDTTNGNLAQYGTDARDGADNFCEMHRPAGITCNNIHALVSLSTDDEIRDMPTNYGVNVDAPVRWIWGSTSDYSRIGIASVYVGDNWADILDASILSNRQTGTGDNEQTWTFTASSTGYYSSSYTCNGGTTSSSSVHGYYGRPDSTNSAWIISSYHGCNYDKRLMCLCY